jgi:glycosyltransferase involved in cell wall biosynthesis
MPSPLRWRIDHVITRLILGGAQENTVASVLGLRDRPDFDVRLLSGPTAGAEGSIEHRVDQVPGCLVRIPDLTRPVHPWADWRAFLQLRQVFRHHRPHIVHTHAGKAGILGRLAAHSAGVPLIIHTIHGPSFGSFQGPVPNWIFRNAEKKAAQHTDFFVSVAEAMIRQYQEAGIGSPERHARIYSGFDLDPFLHATRDPQLAARLGIRPDDFVIGKVARLFALKGHEELIDALPTLVRHIPNLRVLLVGDGPWRPRFEKQVAQAGLSDRVIFAGLVPAPQVPAYLALTDVLVHLSRREGLARVLPQALATGKPIVATDCDGASEVCITGKTGFLIAPDDQPALVEGIRQLAADSELRRSMGAAGREFVRSRFSTQRMVDDLDALYRRLLREKSIEPS